MLSQTYRTSLSLLTDLYQLTMAYGYWKLGRSEQEAIFHLFFRTVPFGGGYALAAGLGPVIEYLQRFSFDESDLAYLKTLVGNDGQSLFDPEFLDYLAQLELSIDVEAIPEGTVAFGHEPLLKIRGPILQCQLLETPLLNIINFQTLIATKASRITSIAGDDPVLEFGLRRAQGMDGALAASRAAYIGGCAATSNVLAGKLYGIPVKGTHAHSWVMSFDTEAESFERYAEVLPNNCVFLVDTYDTIAGVHQAVEVGKRLRSRGYEMVGIRLDSGDLAQLSKGAREILDQAGFPDASIVASNDLDEYAMEKLRKQGAQIGVWGIGTKLATAYDQPALGGVYKLGALRDDKGNWQPKVKLSEQTIKTSIPGSLQVRRFRKDSEMHQDMIYDEIHGIDEKQEIADLKNPGDRTKLQELHDYDDLLVPVMRQGELICEHEALSDMRQRAQENLGRLNAGIRQLDKPQQYSVGLDIGLYQRRDAMIQSARVD